MEVGQGEERSEGRKDGREKKGIVSRIDGGEREAIVGRRRAGEREDIVSRREGWHCRQE